MKTALITGSSKGLGRSLALAFAKGGYNIILHGRDVERLKEVQDKILSLDSTNFCCSVIGDISSEETIDNIFPAIQTYGDGLDILINNVATHAEWGSLFSSEIDIKNVISVNLTAPLIITNMVLPWLDAGGLIININSIACKYPNYKESVYCASKYGLKGFSESIKHEALKNRIEILDVYLGAMKTDMVKNRPDFDKFIDPDEAAELIFGLSQSHKSLTIREVEIGRRNY